MMISRFCLAIVFILSSLISIQSQNKAAANGPLDSSEVTEAAKLAVEAAQLYQQGKYKEALPLAKRCLQIREKVFGPSDDALRIALNNLAQVYMALGKYENAEPLYERLIKSYEESAPADPRLVRALQALGRIEFFAGEQGQSERLFVRSLELTEKAYAADGPEVASAASYLAEYYQSVGNFKKAEPLFQRIFAITEQHTPGGDSEEYRQARDRYACVLYKTGQEEQAREVERRSTLLGPGSTPIAGQVINGRAISLPRPPYPDEARTVRASGTVTVRVVIDETGKVIRACAVHGPSILMRASELAAFNAVFSPTKLSGQPVKVTGMITYNFVAH